MTNIATCIRDQIEATRLVDTHEHLPDESIRLAFKPIGGWRDWDWVLGGKASTRTAASSEASIVDDWSFLLSHYVCDDLCSAGLPAELMSRFWCEEALADVKFDWIAPHWKHVRHTGFGQAIRYTLKLLYDEEDLTRASAPRIAERYAELRRPGLYDHVLRKIARIDHCHVNSFTSSIFHVTERPGIGCVWGCILESILGANAIKPVSYRVIRTLIRRAAFRERLRHSVR